MYLSNGKRNRPTGMFPVATGYLSSLLLVGQNKVAFPAQSLSPSSRPTSRGLSWPHELALYIAAASVPWLRLPIPAVAKRCCQELVLSQVEGCQSTAKAHNKTAHGASFVTARLQQLGRAALCPASRMGRHLSEPYTTTLAKGIGGVDGVAHSCLRIALLYGAYMLLERDSLGCMPTHPRPQRPAPLAYPVRHPCQAEEQDRHRLHCHADPYF